MYSSRPGEGGRVLAAGYGCVRPGWVMLAEDPSTPDAPSPLPSPGRGEDAAGRGGASPVFLHTTRHPAIDRDRRPRDVRRLLRAQERDGGGDLAGLAEPAGGDLLAALGEHLV